MKVVMFEAFNQRPKLVNLPDPYPEPHGVVVKVEATGVCRSDWHGWVGHDTDILLPHVPGHELAGVVTAVGKDVSLWKTGDRVTVPFVGGCGGVGLAKQEVSRIVDLHHTTKIDTIAAALSAAGRSLELAVSVR